MAAPPPQPPPPPLWRLPTYASLFADSFIEGTELEGGHIALSLSVLQFVLGRVVQRCMRDGVAGSQLLGLSGSWCAADFRQLQRVSALVSACAGVARAAAQADSPEALLPVLGAWREQLEALPVGGTVLAPAGWNGLTSRNNVLLVIERPEAARYAVVVCNTGRGLEYHPSHASDTDATPPKLKYKTCVRLEGITATRLLDPGFWTMVFALWCKPKPSEYHRAELLYDVLLPWLTGGAEHQGHTLQEAMLASAANDPCAHWRTPQRAASGSTRCILEAVRYLLLRAGLTNDHCKRLSYALRLECMHKVTEDLLYVAWQFPSTAQPLLASVQQQQQQQQQQLQQQQAQLQAAQAATTTNIHPQQTPTTPNSIDTIKSQTSVSNTPLTPTITTRVKFMILFFVESLVFFLISFV